MNRGATALAGVGIGVVIGFLLGGFGPRRQLAIAEAEVVALEEELENTDAPSRLRSPVPGLNEILRERRREEPRTSDAGIALDGGTAADDGEWDEGADDDEQWDDDPLEAYRHAASLQRVRTVQSRAALQEQGDLSDAEMNTIDAAIARMNDELLGYGEELMFLALQGTEPEPSDLLGITHDVTGVLHEAQLELLAVVEERSHEIDEEALEIWNYIDLDRLEPAARAAIDRSE